MYSRQEIDQFIAKHASRFAGYDEAITACIQAFPKSIEYHHVLNKVVVINRLYSTNIFDVDGMARKIIDLGFDARIQHKDLTLVRSIATADPRYSKNKNYNYSFATKYCNWHCQDGFPVFDSMVRAVVATLNRRYKFSPVRVKDYWDYAAWKQIIDETTTFFGIQDYRYKIADKYLWALGTTGGLSVV